MSDKNDNRIKVVLTPEEFYARGEKSDLLERAYNAIKNDRDAFDRIRFKRDRDWSELANKVVGTE